MEFAASCFQSDAFRKAHTGPQGISFSFSDLHIALWALPAYMEAWGAILTIFLPDCQSGKDFSEEFLYMPQAYQVRETGIALMKQINELYHLQKLKAELTKILKQ